MSTETAGTTRHTGPRTAEAGSERGPGAGALARIDELDAGIIALVQERRRVSAGIRQSRTEPGEGPAGDGSRTGSHGGLAREMEILNRYRSELGRPGTQLAMTLLALCRTRP